MMSTSKLIKSYLQKGYNLPQLLGKHVMPKVWGNYFQHLQKENTLK